VGVIPRHKQIQVAASPAQVIRQPKGDTTHRLEYTHLALLLRVDDDKADALVNDILAGEWSVKELSNYLRSKAQESNRPSRPSYPKPTTFLAFVEQVAAQAGQCRKAYEESWEEGQALLDAFTAVPAEKLDEACRKRVQEVAQLAKETAGGLKGIAVELASIEKRIAGTLSQRRSGGKPFTIPGGDEPQVYCEPSYPDDDDLEEDDE
jgi:hypothetical protein